MINHRRKMSLTKSEEIIHNQCRSLQEWKQLIDNHWQRYNSSLYEFLNSPDCRPDWKIDTYEGGKRRSLAAVANEVIAEL
jgi:hypothetical protein